MRITKTTCKKKTSKNADILIGDYISNIQIKGTKKEIETILQEILEKGYNNLIYSTTLEIRKYLVASLMSEEIQQLIFSKMEKLDKLENHGNIDL